MHAPSSAPGETSRIAREFISRRSAVAPRSRGTPICARGTVEGTTVARRHFFRTFQGLCQCGRGFFFTWLAQKSSLSWALVLISFSWPASKKSPPKSSASFKANSTVAFLLSPDFLLFYRLVQVLVLFLHGFTTPVLPLLEKWPGRRRVSPRHLAAAPIFCFPHSWCRLRCAKTPPSCARKVSSQLSLSMLSCTSSDIQRVHTKMAVTSSSSSSRAVFLSHLSLLVCKARHVHPKIPELVP